jgi:branched-chain amino acid aminotransferase
MTVKIHPEALEKMKQYSLPAGELAFGKYMAPIMIIREFTNGKWNEAELVPYQNLAMDPCTKVLHYGQEIFEGMKAYKNTKGEVFLFRPDKNANRFNHSAERMSMPQIPVHEFIESIEVISKHCSHVIPQRPGEALYLRPFMIASEVGLGIKPANRFHFVVVASPSGNYFSSPNVKVYIERELTRAAPGGTGSAKTGGNYAGSLSAYRRNLTLGLDQTLWLDAIHKKYIEEMSGMNFFAVINDEIHTPELHDTILEGVTRESLLLIAKELGYKTFERKIDVDDLMKLVQSGQCSEAFVCGTASVLVPISSFHEGDGKIYSMKNPEGKISKILREKMLSIQTGLIPSPDGWIRKIN